MDNTNLSFVPNKSVDEKIACIPCHLAKHQRLPFPISDSCVDSIFKLIYVDLWDHIDQKHYKSFIVAIFFDHC